MPNMMPLTKLVCLLVSFLLALSYATVGAFDSPNSPTTSLDDDNNISSGSSISDLPTDLIEEISSSISLRDQVSLFSTSPLFNLDHSRNRRTNKIHQIVQKISSACQEEFTYEPELRQQLLFEKTTTGLVIEPVRVRCWETIMKNFEYFDHIQQLQIIVPDTVMYDNFTLYEGLMELIAKTVATKSNVKRIDLLLHSNDILGSLFPISPVHLAISKLVHYLAIYDAPIQQLFVSNFMNRYSVDYANLFWMDLVNFLSVRTRGSGISQLEVLDISLNFCPNLERQDLVVLSNTLASSSLKSLYYNLDPLRDGARYCEDFITNGLLKDLISVKDSTNLQQITLNIEKLWDYRTVQVYEHHHFFKLLCTPSLTHIDINIETMKQSDAFEFSACLFKRARNPYLFKPLQKLSIGFTSTLVSASTPHIHVIADRYHRQWRIIADSASGIVGILQSLHFTTQIAPQFFTNLQHLRLPIIVGAESQVNKFAHVLRRLRSLVHCNWMFLIPRMGIGS